MVFSSLLFLFRFFPLFLIAYFIVPKPFRNLILFLFSLVFYAWGEPVYVLLMLVTITIGFFHGKWIDAELKKGNKKRAKGWVISSVVLCLLILGFFKYSNFLIQTINDLTGAGIARLSLSLPIGISFYTFQTLSYTIDVYRREAKVQNNYVSFGTYVSMFPQLIAGPIVTYKTIDEQLSKRTETVTDFAAGIHQFMTGLGKKVLLANNIGILWDTISGNAAGSNTIVMAWMGLAAYTFQIYFDFSGYSDMAIGLGRMIGFRFLENFNYPYISKSITEFWRRWHISLSTWFRDYVYIPLGGNRQGIKKQIRNILVVWLLTGIWHGASWNFVTWGLYYGLLLLLEKFVLKKFLDKLPCWVQHVYALFFIMIGWNLFAFDSLGNGLAYMKSLFGGYGQAWINRETIYLLYNYAVLFILLILASTRLPKLWAQKLMNRLEAVPALQTAGKLLFYAVIFLLSIAYLVDASYNPFLYFRF